MEKTGFGGVLLYIDPCDLPKTANLSYNTFMVSLNPGGDPSTPGYPSIGKFTINPYYSCKYYKVAIYKYMLPKVIKK